MADKVIASDQFVMLWLDLDRLAEDDDGDLAHHARESLERLSEELDRRHDLRVLRQLLPHHL